MDDTVKFRLDEWLGNHDDNLRRFTELVPLATVATETELSPETIREAVVTSQPPIYHVWSHTYARTTRPNKPYCLRLGPADAVCLDWEDSVVAAAQTSFRQLGYSTCRELGTAEHIECLLNEPDVSHLQAGVNLRDLWAYCCDGDSIDFWIIEAKGKEAGGFDRYCFAEALSQLFEVPSELLTKLLGAPKSAGHGLCYKFATQLLTGWQQRGWRANITLAVLIPCWDSDVVWDGGKARPRSRSYYQRPIDEVVEFINQGSSHASSKKKGESVFGQILEWLENSYSIRVLSRSNSGIKFRVLTARDEPTTGKFSLHEFPLPSRHH